MLEELCVKEFFTMWCYASVVYAVIVCP